MKIKDMSTEELKTLSYADIAYMIIKEKGKSLNTPAVFKKVCSLLEYTDEQYNEKIGDFYTTLTTDKRFLLLDSAEWDLREKHVVKIEVVDDEDDELETPLDEEEEEEEEETEDEENIDEVIDDDLDDTEDDLEDLSVVTDEELE